MDEMEWYNKPYCPYCMTEYFGNYNPSKVQRRTLRCQQCFKEFIVENRVSWLFKCEKQDRLKIEQTAEGG